MGEARRNFISGFISISIAWPFLDLSGKGHENSYSESVEWLVSLIDKHSITILLLGFLIIFIGRIVDFFGGLVPTVYDFLINIDSKKPSVFIIFFISLYRSLKRNRKYCIIERWKIAHLLAEKLEKIIRQRAKRHKEGQFKSNLTSSARKQFDKLPEIVKDGLINPFGWNFDISINFMTSQSSQKKSYWILHRENRRKFVYMVLCSVFLPILVLIFASMMINMADFMINIDEIFAKFDNMVKNGFPDENDNQNRLKEINSISEIDQPILFVCACVVLFFFLFICYVQYVKSCCVLYAEVFTLGRYVQQEEQGKPGDDSLSSGFVEDRLPLISVKHRGQ